MKRNQVNFAEIESLTLDLDLAIARVRHDLERDWFPDPLEYKDTLSPEVIIDYLAQHKYRYRPAKSQILNIPKSNFLMRYATEVCIYDRLIYQALGDILVEHLDRSLLPCVYSHRSNKKKDKYMFGSGVTAWKDFLGHVKIAYEKKDGNVLLVTDVQNYYENIRVRDIETVLSEEIEKLDVKSVEKDKLAVATRILVGMLSNWSIYQEHGIPQNRKTSSLISNILMLQIDRKMIGLGYQYFRYMDDIRIVCDDLFMARKALRDLIIFLRELGLNVNPKKTNFICNTSGEKEEYLPSRDPEMDRIDNAWKSKKRDRIINSIPQLQIYTQRFIDDNKTQSGKFRFCINKLEKIARCEELKRLINFEPFTDKVIDNLTEQPWSTDMFVRYLRSVDLTNLQLDRIKDILILNHLNIYDWQCYHLWLLLTQKQFEDAQLIAKAQESLETGSIDSPNAAGAMIYLGSISNENTRLTIAKNYKDCISSLTKRCAIIATHELSFSKHIQTHIKPHITPDTEGMYRRIRSNSRGKYISPLRAVTPEELYDELQEIFS